MSQLMAAATLSTFLAIWLANTVPVMVAACGEAIGESAGVLNLGVTGSMLLGGYAAFATSLATGSSWLGFAAGAASGLACSALFAALCIGLGLNQIVVGIAITLAGEGLTSVLYSQTYSEASPRLGEPDPIILPGLGRLPVLGDSVFAQPAMFYLSFLLLAAAAFTLGRTHLGLRIRAAGQRPAALAASGFSVGATRWLASLVAGTLAGLGGAYLVQVTTGTFTPFMVGGLGMIAIVIAMIARGLMRWIILASLAHGLFAAVGGGLHVAGIAIPADVLKMLPFVAVMVVLITFSRTSLLPPALGTAYRRGER